MSKLESFNSERIYWAVEQVEQEAGDIEYLHLDDNLFYIKSDVDKEIDFWKNESHKHYENWFNLNKQYEGWFGKVVRCERVERELRRQKYKRCLGMVKLCAKNVDHLNSEGYIYEKENQVNERDDCIRRAAFYHRWYNRWLKLARRFEER